MKFREKMILDNKIFVTCIFLDPVLKELLSKQEIAMAVRYILCLKERMDGLLEKNNLPTFENHQNSERDLYEDDIIEYYIRQNLSSERKVEKVDESFKSSLKSYKLEKRPIVKLNCLDFWSKRYATYPELSAIALSIRSKNYFSNFYP